MYIYKYICAKKLKNRKLKIEDVYILRFYCLFHWAIYFYFSSRRWSSLAGPRWRRSESKSSPPAVCWRCCSWSSTGTRRQPTRTSWRRSLNRWDMHVLFVVVLFTLLNIGPSLSGRFPFRWLFKRRPPPVWASTVTRWRWRRMTTVSTV